MTAMILKLITTLGPIWFQAYQEHQAEHNGVAPTAAELQARIVAHGDRYLAEGDAWLAAHPEV